jgi:hypothetical protein
VTTSTTTPTTSPATDEPADELPVDESLVARAEQDAAEAEALAEALAERVRDGQDVTPEELANAEQLGRFARLRVDAARRQLDRARRAHYARQCAELAAEMDTHATHTGHQLAALLRTAEQAVVAFLDAADERNQQITTWRRRMTQLGVPQHTTPLAPPAEHARLGWSDNGLHLGRRQLHRVSADQLLTGMLRHIEATRRDHTGRQRTLHINTRTDHANPYGYLAALDAPAEEPTAQHFYRGPTGSVIARDRAYTAEEITRLELAVITRQEAWGE